MRSRESFLFCAAIGICHWLPKKHIRNTRRASPGGQSLSLSDKINRKKSMKAKGLPGCWVSFWILEHHKPVTMLFLRSVNLRVERFCFLGITKIKWAEMSPDSIFRTFLQHLLENSDTLWVKTHRECLLSVLPWVNMAPQLSVKKMGIISENEWLLSISSSSTGRALTLTVGHGHMKKLNENL